MEVLLQYGADCNYISKASSLTPLLYALKSQNCKVAHSLSASEYPDGAINYAGPDGRTPLSLALEFGSMEVIQRLLEKGADIKKAKTKPGSTYLCFALENLQFKVAELLLEMGPEIAEINETTSDGRTPLSFALQSGYVDAVEFLLDKGADASKPDADGTSPLARAVAPATYTRVFRGQPVPLIQRLLDVVRKEDINQFDSSGLTPLMMAAHHRGHNTTFWGPTWKDSQYA